jgi:hypothetical protein
MIHEYVPKTMEKGGGEYNDNSEPDGATTAKTALTEPVTQTDPTKPTPGAAAKKEEPSPQEENIHVEEKLKAEEVDENNSNKDENVGKSLKHIKPSPREHAAQPAAEATQKKKELTETVKTLRRIQIQRRPSGDQHNNPEMTSHHPYMYPQQQVWSPSMFQIPEDRKFVNSLSTCLNRLQLYSVCLFGTFGPALFNPETGQQKKSIVL